MGLQTPVAAGTADSDERLMQSLLAQVLLDLFYALRNLADKLTP